MRLKILTFCLLVSAIAGCKSTKTIEPIDPIIAGRCRIVGYIVSYTKPTQDNVNSKNPNPCDIYPCKAKVQIVEILGCSPTAPKTLIKGDIVPMEFGYTMGPTNPNLFPKLKKHYQGMDLYSVFKADVTAVHGPDGVLYLVDDYDVMK
jgi:hypothetical protein